MRADSWSFRVTNLVIAAAVAGALWWLFYGLAPDYVFLVPLYWIMHIRSMHSRLREIEGRTHALTDILRLITKEDDDPQNSIDIENILDKYGFDDDEDEDYPLV